jgi:hypothetical protein
MARAFLKRRLIGELPAEFREVIVLRMRAFSTRQCCGGSV